MSIDSRTASYGSPVGYETLTVSSTALSLTPTAGAKAALVTVDTAAVRWRSDGGASPTAASGMYVPAGTMFEIGASELASIEFIRVTVDAVVCVTYYA